MHTKTTIVSITILFIAFSTLFSQIRVNQIGFYPQQQKMAAVIGAASDSFYLHAQGNTAVRFSGVLADAMTWSYSGEIVRMADFSSFQDTGTFTLAVTGVSTSYPFRIAPDVYRTVSEKAMKGFYFQRCSSPLLAVYAGQWARSLGHPDNAVVIHPSAASITRPSGSTISSPGGWYDAGDYGKYIVNCGITMNTLLSLYEEFSEFCNSVSLNIPESSDDIPDILNEILWNLRWMLTMQDPGDGGVYHKLTTANFVGFIMPASDQATRYVIIKTTAASLDFAAVMAQAARIFNTSGASYLPSLADSCKNAALAAWNWARLHPTVYFVSNSAFNSTYDPDINTGAYNDINVDPEFAWAASELCITTEQDSFFTIANPLTATMSKIVWWGNPGQRAYYSLWNHRSHLPNNVLDTALLREKILAIADSLRSEWSRSAYRVPMGLYSGHFGWGSNSNAANGSITLIKAFQITQDSTYLWAAMANLDYLLGRNATGYCFITGCGTLSPMHIHHAPSVSDGIVQPYPGLLAGGPNANAVADDGCSYTSTFPAKLYSDNTCSYSTNEICINWQAPLVFTLLALRAIWGDTLGSGAINMVANSDFSSISQWTFYQENGASASFSIDNGMGRVAITNGAVNTTDIQLYQRGLYFSPGKIYRVNFKAKSSVPRTLRVSLHLQNSPWTSIWSQIVNLDSALQTFGEFAFVFNGFGTSEYRINFMSGGNNNSIWIDDVEVYEVLQTNVKMSKIRTNNLISVFPNPFNPSTRISYGLTLPQTVEVAVFDISGQRVRLLVSRAEKAGVHTVEWNGCDQRDRLMGSGVYLIKLKMGNREMVRRAILIR